MWSSILGIFRSRQCWSLGRLMRKCLPCLYSVAWEMRAPCVLHTRSTSVHCTGGRNREEPVNESQLLAQASVRLVINQPRRGGRYEGTGSKPGLACSSDPGGLVLGTLQNTTGKPKPKVISLFQPHSLSLQHGLTKVLCPRQFGPFALNRACFVRTKLLEQTSPCGQPILSLLCAADPSRGKWNWAGLRSGG